MKKIKQNSGKSICIRIQQDMIELLENVFFETKSIEELTSIMDKSRSTVYRLIRGMQTYGAFAIHLDEKFHSFLTFANKLNESEIDRAFANNQQTPLVYIFLKALIRKEQKNELKLAEIQQLLGLSSQKEAVKIRNSILNTTYLGNFQIDNSDPWWNEA